MKTNIAEYFRSALTLISPRLNATVVYAVKKHRFMRWKDPRTFPEKLVKLRIEKYNRDPLVKKCADKYEVRGYITEKGYGSLLNRLIAAYDRPGDIDWSMLPDRFALKLNYGCGFNLICRDKSRLDRDAAVKTMETWLKQKPWLSYAELQYKDVPAKILAEAFLSGKDGLFPEDYKIYCFNGVPKAILYMSGRYSDSMRVGFFDTEWNYLGTPKKHYLGFDTGCLPPAPGSLATMLKAAADLSAPFPFVRVDFYDLDGSAVFGEMTFSPAGGFDVSEIDVHGESMADMLTV